MLGARTLQILIAIALAAGRLSAHGGQYAGPNTGGPGTGGPAAGPATAGPMGPTTLAGSLGPDPLQWDLWWENNRDAFLQVKTHVRSAGPSTGGEGWFLGSGEPLGESMGLSDAQVRTQVVPALLATLERAGGNDVVTGCLVALAKVGADGDGDDARRFEATAARYLREGSQEVRETAAVALGILANPRSIPMLSHLLWDTEYGRELVKKKEVDYRTRSFAAYGLGLIGARTESPSNRAVIVGVLRHAFEGDATKTPDLQVACLVALSIVPLAPAGTPPPTRARRALPLAEHSRQEEIAFALAVLADEERHDLVRAQCPIALARLVAGLSGPVRDAERARACEPLLEMVARDDERPELLQSCILALGAMGTNDGQDALDARIRAGLRAAVEDVADNQARAFALMALAQAGGTGGADPGLGGLDEVGDFLRRQLGDGRRALRPWAGLACGVLGHRLLEVGAAQGTLEELRNAVRITLTDTKDSTELGAYALAAGLLHDGASSRGLLVRLDESLPDAARGYVAVALGLMGEREAREPLYAVARESKYHPALLRDCVTALALLDDKEVVPFLAGMLKEARGLASQASVCVALGSVGDRLAVDPLLAVLQSPLVTENARAFAAVALGNVADKESLPWNAKLTQGLNYQATTPTLSDPGSSSGILDIL